MTFGSSGNSGSEQVKAQSYEEMLRDNRLNPHESVQIRAQATLAQATHLLLQRGDNKLAMLLLDVVRVETEYVDDRYEPDRIWLEVAPEQLGAFGEAVVDKLREVCNEIEGRRDYNVTLAGVRDVLPEVGPGWQESLRKQLLSGKKPSNAARTIQSEPRRFNADGLSFTNDGELAVYRALKKIQESLPPDETIGIFPLPGGKLPFRTLEPDVLVTYKRRAGVLEIDGPHHNGRRALDMSRDSLWVDAGVAHVGRITVEALNNPRELEAFLKKFLRRVEESK